MASKYRIDTRYTVAGEPRLKVTNTTPKASDIKISQKHRAAPPAKPKPYISMLPVDLVGYLKVTAERVPVDCTTDLVWTVWTKGGRGGAVYVDTWGQITPDKPRSGFVALRSARTSWTLWVETEDDLEREVAIAIARVTGVKHPLRSI